MRNPTSSAVVLRYVVFRFSAFANSVQLPLRRVIASPSNPV